jgi:glycosyltransferase involved in cell wall biosynthesis
MNRLTFNQLPLPPAGKTGWPWISDRPPLPELVADGAPWPKITIVTPSYNQGMFLEETIRSVLLQGYPNLEYIIIDGGSTDQSVEIIRKYEPWLAYWVSEKDKGQADAINKGWQHSSGDFLGWLNSDDLLTPGCLETEARYFVDHPEVGFVFGDMVRIDKDSVQFAVETFRDFDIVDIVKRAGWISQQGNLMRKSVFEQVGPLDISLHFMMDLDLWFRAGLVCRFGYINQPVACFRRHDTAKTATRMDLAAEDIITVYTKLFNAPHLPDKLLLIKKEAWGSAYLNAAERHFMAGDLSSSWSCLGYAFQNYPKALFSRRQMKFVLKLAIASAMGGKSSHGFLFAQRLKAALAGDRI